MTDQEVFDFCWDWKRDWFNTDQFVKRFFWKRWDFEEFKVRATRRGILTKGMVEAIEDKMKEI